jgi:peptidoglycan hydrolase-like protein with peptidoglycan-binding domain
MITIRTAFSSSLLLAAALTSGAALAAPAPQPKEGGVPHTDAADKTAQHVKVTRGPGYERTRATQHALAERHLYDGKVDGVWGAKTEAALRDFQSRNNLQATGELNRETEDALGITADKQPVSYTDAPRTAPPAKEDASTNVQLSTLTQDQAKEMQQRLQLLGYYRGPIDGSLGEGTRGALEHYFRHQADLASKGVISTAAIGLFGTEPRDVKTTTEK